MPRWETLASYDGEDLASIASFTAAVLGVVVVLFTAARARKEILGSVHGWVLVALAMALLAVRVLGHFIDAEPFQLFRRVAGITASVLLPLGLYLILRSLDREKEDDVAALP